MLPFEEKESIEADSAQEFHFLSLVQRTLQALSLMFEALPQADCDELPGVLTIELPDKRIYLFNSHASQRQLWMSSPFSGGRHFLYEDDQWMDTRNQAFLYEILIQEIKKAYGVLLSPPSLSLL